MRLKQFLHLPRTDNSRSPGVDLLLRAGCELGHLGTVRVVADVGQFRSVRVVPGSRSLLADDSVVGNPLGLLAADGDGMLHVRASRVACVIAVRQGVVPLVHGLALSLDEPQLGHVVHDVVLVVHDWLGVVHDWLGVSNMVMGVVVVVTGVGKSHGTLLNVGRSSRVVTHGTSVGTGTVGEAGRRNHIRLLVDDDDLGLLLDRLLRRLLR